jgi:hypothetical protein
MYVTLFRVASSNHFFKLYEALTAKEHRLRSGIDSA